MKRILCSWFPRWPVQRVLAARPELSRRGIALWVARPNQGQSILTCDRRAQQHGVRLGMPLSEAMALATAGRIEFQPHDPFGDALALQELAAWCEKFSPLVGLEDSPAPESLLLDVTGLAPLFEGEESLARLILRDLARRHFTARVAVAECVGAAWGAARFLAADGKPAVIPRGSYSILRSLPIEALRLSEASVALFHQLGIERIKQVAVLPRSSLKARFGPEILLRLDQLEGQCAELIQAHRPLPEFHQRWSWEFPITSPQAIQDVVALLMERLTATLSARLQGIVELECRFELEEARPLVLMCRLYQPTIAAGHLSELVRLQLERLRLPAPVIGIRVEARQTAPLVQQQYELFGSGTPQQSQALANLVNRLSGRLEREAVVRPQLLAEAVPERACSLIPFGQRPKKSRRAGHKPFAPLERPLRLLAEPVPLEVIATVPAGPPAAFFYRQVRHNILQVWGPERIEAAWWRGTSVRRDYYRVQTSTGKRFWLFRRLQDLRWFLHGEFA